MESINLLRELDSMSKMHTLKRDDIDAIMQELAERILVSLKLERMSVWLFNQERDVLVSMGEFELPGKIFKKESTLSKEEYPTYFQLVSENEILLIENVYKHPATVELAESYCVENNVISLMDIPLRIGGEMVGVMCFEKTGNTERVFNAGEQTFALSLSLVFASNLEARQRRVLQNTLDQELKEKVLLIKEIHHRVKNNLTIISSLINLQSSKVKDAHHKSLFDEHRSKIDSIAIIHELVYKSKNFTEINLKKYLNEIISNLLKVYYSDREEVALETDLDEIVVDLSIALPLGLIINEIITNSFKHAFAGMSNGKISVSLKQEDDFVTLIVSDNGRGLEPKDKKELSYGMDILSGLVEQIDGKYSFENHGGTVFSMRFNILQN